MKNSDHLKEKLRALQSTVPEPPHDQAAQIWSRIQASESKNTSGPRSSWWNMKWALGLSAALTALSLILIPNPMRLRSESNEEDYVSSVYGNALDEIESSYEIVDASYEELSSFSREL